MGTIKPILYSTGCPRCKVLEAKLNYNHIEYDIVTDVDTIQKLGVESIPVLKVGEELLDFGNAVNWVNEQ